VHILWLVVTNAITTTASLWLTSQQFVVTTRGNSSGWAFTGNSGNYGK